MRRLLIIGAILVALWLIFGRETVPSQNEETTSPETTQSQEEEKLEKTEKKEEKETSVRKKTPQAVMPTPPELVEKVEQNGNVASAEAQTKASVVSVSPKEKSVEEIPMSTQPFVLDTKIKVYLYEWGVDVSQSVVPAGNIGFEVINSGQFSHHFAIRGVKDFGKIIPGATVLFSAPLTEGQFELYSPRNIDVEQGMKETLRVENK